MIDAEHYYRVNELAQDIISSELYDVYAIDRLRDECNDLIEQIKHGAVLSEDQIILILQDKL